MHNISQEYIMSRSNIIPSGHRVSSHEKKTRVEAYNQTVFVQEVCGLFCSYFPNMEERAFLKAMEQFEEKLALIYRKASGKKKAGVKKEGEE
jgi:hypothetical protein